MDQRSSRFGILLKHWRKVRDVTQLHLALEAGVSTRHLSFIESGRARPSREMVTSLATALDLSPHDCNVLLSAAGYMPVFPDGDLDGVERSMYHRAVESVLTNEEPYPALVVDSIWTVFAANRTAARLLEFMGPEAESIAPPFNLISLMFDPEGMRPSIVNWDELATYMVRVLLREVGQGNAFDAAAEILDAIRKQPGATEILRNAQEGDSQNRLITIHIQAGALSVRFFNATMFFGMSQDFTMSKLRIEIGFPADQGTQQLFEQIASS